MSKEELKNNNININEKCEDMILSAKSIVEHHLFVSDGRCEPPSYICLAYDVKNYLPKLLQENQQLKEDIKGYKQERQKIYNSIPFKENKQLKEQVEYLRRSCERKEDAIISLQQDLTIIDELEKWCKSFTTEEFNYNFLVVRIKDILDKISELKGEKMSDKEKLEEIVKTHLKDIAKIIQGLIPENYGFIFMTYEHKNLGQLMYISNSNREDVVKCLEEFIEKTKDNYGNDTGKY